jgi:hypothetical protein
MVVSPPAMVINAIFGSCSRTFSSESWTRFRSPQNPGPAVPRARLPRTRKPGRRLPPPRGVDTAAGWRITPPHAPGSCPTSRCSATASRSASRWRPACWSCRTGQSHAGAGPPGTPLRVPGQSPAWRHRLCSGHPLNAVIGLTKVVRLAAGADVAVSDPARPRPPGQAGAIRSAPSARHDKGTAPSEDIHHFQPSTKGARVSHGIDDGVRTKEFVG